MTATSDRPGGSRGVEVTAAGGARELPVGVEIRPLADDRDFGSMVAVFDAAKAADRVERSRTPEEYRASLRSRREAGASPEVLLATVDGTVVGWCQSWAGRATVDGVRYLEHVGFVHPAWRRRGIGSALIARTTERLERLTQPGESAWAAESARTGDAPACELMTESNAREADAAALLGRLGYAPARFVAQMVRPTLDDPPDDRVPDGLDLRPATRDTATTIVRALDEAFHDHWAWTPMSDEQIRAGLEHPLLGQLDVWQVAWDGDEVAGGVLGWIDAEENREYRRRRGYTEAIFTRRPWRGRGLATALIGRNLRLLRDRGMTEAALSVDTENRSGALALYERVGFREVGRDVVWTKPLDRT